MALLNASVHARAMAATLVIIRSRSFIDNRELLHSPYNLLADPMRSVRVLRWLIEHLIARGTEVLALPTEQKRRCCAAYGGECVEVSTGKAQWTAGQSESTPETGSDCTQRTPLASGDGCLGNFLAGYLSMARIWSDTIWLPGSTALLYHTPAEQS